MNHYIKQESNNWNELVFEDRNKAYGAYVIRESYDRTILKSYLIVLSVLALLSAIAISVSKLTPNDIHELADRTTTVITEIFPPEVVPPVKTTPPPPQGGNRQSTTTPVITNRERDSTDEPVDTATHFMSPEGPSAISSPASGSTNSSVQTSIKIPTEGSSSSNATLIPDELPEFPGGVAAMHHFIQDRLRISEGIPVERTRIVVTFVIDPQGKIIDLKPVSNNGFGMEESLMRTVEQMPDWKPGKKNNHAVYVRMMLPVTYEVH